MQEQEQNRTEQATPFKRSEAKKRGQVAKSLEFNTLVMILGLLTVMAMLAKTYWHGFCQLCVELFASAAKLQIDATSAPGIFSEIGHRTFAVVLPFMVAGVVAATVANVIQTGPIFSGEPLKPKFERLNPAAGFKRLFNKKMLFEAFKGVVKLVFFGAIAYAFLRSLMPGVAEIARYDVDGEANWLGTHALSLLFRLGIGLLIVGLIDLAFVRWQFSQQMMMSRREMKEEVKRREGDPQIRAKIRELQRENLKQARSMGRLPDADVLITNPDHLAVALRYDRETSNAPVVIAKGSDSWAQEMKALARRHGIPILERKPLARLLFSRTQLDQPIPGEAFLEVARVYAELAQLNRDDSRYEVTRR